MVVFGLEQIHFVYYFDKTHFYPSTFVYIKENVFIRLVKQINFQGLDLTVEIKWKTAHANQLKRSGDGKQ